jgi:Polyketide cyclase / dehydrase and lipid transport
LRASVARVGCERQTCSSAARRGGRCGTADTLASPSANEEGSRAVSDLTESSITISASPEQVMAVVTDFAAYPDWNDEVKSVEILSHDEGSGHPDEVAFELDAGVIKDQYVLKYEWVSDVELRWHLVRGEILKAMDGLYLLTAVDGGTDVSYRLVVDLKIPMIGLIKRKAERVIIERALKGLKERVET